MVPGKNLRCIAIIPARGGSKRIYRKNLRLCAGEPLIRWTIEAAKKSQLIDDIVVTTEDDEIADYCARFDVRICKRDEGLAEDGIHSVVPVLDALKRSIEYSKKKKNIPYGVITMLLPTSPLRCGYEIDNSIYLLEEIGAPSIVGVTTMGGAGTLRYIDDDLNIHHVTNFDKSKQASDQQQLHKINGAIFTANVEIFRKTKTFHMEKTMPMYMSPVSGVEVDTVAELEMAELLLYARAAKEMKD